jgi:predicted phage terminase large subunit-like protein
MALALPQYKTRPGEEVIAPQPGPQTQFLSTPAQVAIYGGSAGGGKSWALLLDALRETGLSPVPGYGAVIFRRTSKQVTQEGGLWDESGKLYPLTGGVPNQTRLEWAWPESRTRVRFTHLQYDKDKLSWQGAQVPYIGFDELTHFERSQFFYLSSRNRSMSGGRRVIRGTTNPDPDSWVKRFIAPWVDDDYERPVSSGTILKYFVEEDTIRFVHPGDRLPRHVKTEDLRTLTFIRASIWDNKKLLEQDPEYLSTLKALPLVDRERLLNGDWNIREEGNVFKRGWFRIIDRSEVPSGLELVWRWDLAATEETAGRDPDYTAGVLMGYDRATGRIYILDTITVRESPGGVERLILSTAQAAGKRVAQVFPQDPGAAGKTVASAYVRMLAGWDVHAYPESGSKAERARPFSAQAEAGNVSLVRAPWNDGYLNQLTGFPRKGRHDDLVDASSGAFAWLMDRPMARIRWFD